MLSVLLVTTLFLDSNIAVSTKQPSVFLGISFHGFKPIENHILFRKLLIAERTFIVLFSTLICL